MKSNPKVSVIIVNWNGKKIIGEAINSMLNQAYKNIEIIVVDNNSSDGSVSYIRKNFKEVIVVESFVNTGFAEGNNLGFERSTGEYVLLLNSDALVTKDFLSPLLDVLKSEKKVGIVQPLVLYKDNDFHQDDVVNSAGTYFLNTGFLYYKNYGQSSKNLVNVQPSSIVTAYGACMLIKREIIDTIELFDKDFFMYFEETDFCMRALLSGWKILYIPQSIVYHKGGVSARKYGHESMIYHSYKNRIASYIKNLQGKTLVKVLLLHILLCKGIGLLYLFTGRFSYFIAVEKAFVWNAIQLPKLLRKRKTIQHKYRALADDEFLPDLTVHPRLSYYLYLFKGLQYYKE